MSCNQGHTTSCENTSGNGFVFVLVLYILLAIILGSVIAC